MHVPNPIDKMDDAFTKTQPTYWMMHLSNPTTKWMMHVSNPTTNWMMHLSNPSAKLDDAFTKPNPQTG
jgi:hypothetical protein